jgi:integrase
VLCAISPSGSVARPIGQGLRTCASFNCIWLIKRLADQHQRDAEWLPVVLSREEATRLIEATRNIKYRAALSVAYGAGLRASEVIGLKVSDVDSKRHVLRIEQGKGRKDRYALPDVVKVVVA